MQRNVSLFVQTSMHFVFSGFSPHTLPSSTISGAPLVNILEKWMCVTVPHYSLFIHGLMVYWLAPGWCSIDLKSVILKLKTSIEIASIPYEFGVRWMPQSIIDDMNIDSANVDADLCRKMESLGHNKLKHLKALIFQNFIRGPCCVELICFIITIHMFWGSWMFM